MENQEYKPMWAMRNIPISASLNEQDKKFKPTVEQIIELHNVISGCSFDKELKNLL